MRIKGAPQDVDTPTVISLYSGGGGLDLGFRMAVPDARVVCYVERDAASIEVLVTNMQKGRLDEAPIWTDSGTFDGKPWRGVVDWIIGGFPCQPWSVAGTQGGTDDERWLWPHIRRIAREVEPRGLFLENVPGLFLGGIQPVLGELAEDGYDAIWTTVRASDVGAPHRRERCFILGHSRRPRPQEREINSGQIARSENTGLAYRDGIRPPAYPGDDGKERCFSEAKRESKHCTFVPRRSGGGVADVGYATGERSQRAEPVQGIKLVNTHARSKSTPMEYPPGPQDADGWRQLLKRDPTVKPAICGDADGLASRVDRLRILGNGVVPEQAALAFNILWEQID